MVPLNMPESKHASRGLSLVTTRKQLLVTEGSFQSETKGHKAPSMPWQQYPSLVCLGSLVVAAVLLFCRWCGTLVRWWIKSEGSKGRKGSCKLSMKGIQVKHTNCMDAALYVEEGRAFCDLDEWYDSNTGTESELGAEATPEFSLSGRRGAICHSLDPEPNDVDAHSVSLAGRTGDDIGACMSAPLLGTRTPQGLQIDWDESSWRLFARPVEKQPCCESSGPTVTFALSLNTHHEVTPYAEVYGTHPNNFNFDKHVEPPSWCFVTDERSDSDTEDENETEATEKYSTPPCRQMTATSGAWEPPKADHGGNHDAQHDASDDEQDTQSPDSSEVNSDGSADSNMGDEDEFGHGS